MRFQLQLEKAGLLNPALLKALPRSSRGFSDTREGVSHPISFSLCFLIFSHPHSYLPHTRIVHFLFAITAHSNAYNIYILLKHIYSHD